METFCGYVLGSGPQRALRNSFIILECHFPTKWRGPTPLFWHTFTKNTFYKMTTLSTHQSPSPFHPVILTAKNQRHFVDNHLCNPICDMSLTMVWGLLTGHYKMANQLFVQTTTSIKWQPGGTTNHLSHLDPLNPGKQFMSMLHPSYHSLSIFINLYLSLTSGYFWWILMVWGWHLGTKWLGCCMVAPFPSITKWQPYKFLKQLPI